MRLDINLASQKFEDVRRFYVRWGAALAALAFLTVLLATLSYLKYSSSTAAARQTTAVQQKIDALEKERSQLAAIENRPENRDVIQQKKFWNTQIAKRSFSWTQLLNDMQKIMPRRAFLDSVQPELTPDNRLKLRLTVTGEQKQDTRELMERMEDSARFHSTRPVNDSIEKDAKQGSPPRYKLEMETFYTPTGPPLSPPPGQDRRSQTSLAHAGAKEEM